MTSKLMRVVCLALGLCLAASGAALAAANDTDTAALLKEINALKAKLGEMDTMKAKLAALEKKLDAQEAAVTAAAPAVAKKGAPDFNINGHFGFNYRNNSFNEYNKARGGNLAFDHFALGVDGSMNDITVSAQYRWYSYMNTIHHAYIGYKFNEDFNGQLGIVQAPFGLLPWAAHNWWFGVPYYLGLADDFDMGLKLHYTKGAFDTYFAFFKNAEWGDPSKLERYSYDVVTSDDQQNEETNTGILRLAYTFKPFSNSSIELGVSGLIGQLYNSDTDSDGSRWAAGPHVNAKFGNLGLQFEAVRYQYNPQNPEGVSDDTVLLGGLADSYLVASEATVYVANISYDIPWKYGVIQGLQVYNDFSMSKKEKDGWEDSYINTVGCHVNADPVSIYLDFILGKNMVYLGGDSVALAQGDPDADWTATVNLNVAYFF